MAMDERRRAKLDQEVVLSVTLAKGFHLYKRRNEWLNWDGYTHVVSRSGRSIWLSLSDAEQDAEQSRIQGTKFVIDELPIICIQAESRAIIIADVFSERPMADYLKQSYFRDGRSVGALVKALPQSKWGLAFPVDGVASVSALDGVYYSRKSSPGKGQSYLAWSLIPRKLDDVVAKNFTAHLKSRLLASAPS